MSPHKSYNKCKLITKLYFTSFDAKAKYWSEQHASWEQLISFTDGMKTLCTLLADFIILNSQRKVCPLGFFYFSWITAWRAGEYWTSLSDTKRRWFEWIFYCEKLNLFWHPPLYLQISQQLFLIFSNSDLLSELFSSG